MIQVTLNRPDFEYDIHSLVKAFYPGQEVQVSAGEKVCEESPDLKIRIDYLEASVRISWEEMPSGQIKSPSFQTEGCDSRRADEDSDAEAGASAHSEKDGRTGSAEYAVDFRDRTEAKNQLKRGLYRVLSELTGEELPWGTLTGIRPAKIAMKLLEQGCGRAAVRQYMQDTYGTSGKKAELACDIAEREKELLSNIDYKNGYSLYIGIPFCPTTCLYCSFPSYPLSMWEGKVDAYLDALEREMDAAAPAFAHRCPDTVYIGGGTPTTLNPSQLDRVIGKIKERFDLSCCREFTVEAGRPDSITEEKLAVLREHGISRISINPQTMKQETLKLIGRHHTVEQTVESYRLARRLGFDNINMDLILGLPEETIGDVRNTMEQLKKLGPDSLTVHSLALKRASKLKMFQEDYKNYRLINTQEHMELAAGCAEEMGLFPYYLYRQKSMAGNLENVGSAKPGKAGMYNVLMMEEKQTILALGAGAVTKFVFPPDEEAPERSGLMERRIFRVENVKDIRNYLSRVDEMIRRRKDKMEEISWH